MIQPALNAAAAVLLCAIGVATAVAGAPAPVNAALPAALVGAWVSDDADGAQQCRSYRDTSAPLANDGVGLIGMLLISPGQMHRVAEMMEGDFYTPTSVESPRADQWAVTAIEQFDGPLDGQDANQVTVHLVLQDEVLWLSVDADQPGADHQVWRRCSRKLPY